MGILILGDIHGRKIWKEIIEKENPDKVIFLGDYVSTHDNISEQEQIENLEEILRYKEKNPEKVILLRGNHDVQHLKYPWAQCSGYFPKVAYWMFENKERFLNNSQWIYLYDNIIFSHAGISQVWFTKSICPYIFDNIGFQYDATMNIVLNQINDIEPCELFGFIPDNMWDMCGESATQSCTWIRPEKLVRHALEGFTQVVGHTPVKDKCVDCFETIKDGEHIWLCDALDQKSYLIIENGEFKSKELS